MRRSGRFAFALLVLSGVLAAAAARPGLTRTPATDGDEIDARRRQANDLNEFNHQLACELARGRIGLGDATDRVVEANADRPGYLTAMRTSVGSPTVRESVARSLVYRAENRASSTTAEIPALRAEYAALFGRPYHPPGS
jgi:hypothetical protein